jgi:exonuclease VII small subunit
MRNLRMSMPQFVTNVTSFKDAVRILKNKSILNETVIKEELDTKKVYGGIGQNQGDTGSSLQFTVIEDNPEYFEIDFTLSPNSKYRQAGAGSRSPREKEYGYAKILKKDFNGHITVKGENFNIGKDFITTNLQINKDNEIKPSEDELDAVIKRMEDEKAGGEAVRAQYDPMEESLNEAKKKDEKNYSVQQANPTELRLGIRTELEHGDMELDKAKEIAYKNIAKDPIYYTKLKLSGVEAHPKKVKGEKVAPAKKAKKESAQLVDLVNGMQKVKMPKADEKKKIKESVDEKMRFQDLPADSEKYKIVRDSKNYIIKATNADGIEFQKGDTVKTYDGEEIKIAKFEESQGKVKAIYNKGMFFASIDIDGLEAPKETMRPGVDMGGSFEKMKKSLEEIVRETISEYFDGRDNLINPLSAEEENN